MLLAVAYLHSSIHTARLDRDVFYLRRAYNPRQRTLSEFDMSVQQHISYFLETDFVIQELRLYLASQSSFAGSTLSLVYQGRAVRVYDCFIDIRLQGAVFRFAAYAHLLLVLQTYCNVSGPVDLNASRISSYTEISVASEGCFAGHVWLPGRLVRQSFALFNGEFLERSPPAGLGGCTACAAEAEGAFCELCKRGTFRNGETCECLYSEQYYSNFTDRCAGNGFEAHEAISNGPQSYIVPCAQRMLVNLGLQFEREDAYVFSVFEDDFCGLSNVAVYGRVVISGTAAEQRFALIVPVATQAIESVVLNVSASFERFCPLATSFFTEKVALTHDLALWNDITITGLYSESGVGKRDVSGTFGLLAVNVSNAKLYLSNVVIHGFGLAAIDAKERAALLFAFVLQSAVETNGVFVIPLYSDITAFTSINVEQEQPDVIACWQNVLSAGLLRSKQLEKLYKNEALTRETHVSVSASSASGISLLAVSVHNSTFSLNNSIVSGEIKASLLSYNLGFVLSYAESSSVAINNTYVDAKSAQGKDRCGVVAQVQNSGVNWQTFVAGVFELQINVPSSGVIGSCYNLNAVIAAVVSLQLKQSTQGAIIGLFDNGVLQLQFLTGNISKLSMAESTNLLIGKIVVGTVDGKAYVNSSLSTHQNAYLNAESIAGYCATNDILIGEFVSTVVDGQRLYYLTTCLSDAGILMKINASFAGVARMQVLRSLDCAPSNLRVSGFLQLDNGTTHFLGIAELCSVGIQALFINLSISYSGGEMREAALGFWRLGGAGTPHVQNVVMSGQISNSYYQTAASPGSVGGLVGLVFSSAEFANVKLVGVRLSFSGGNSCALFVARLQSADNLSVSLKVQKLVVDDFGGAANLDFNVSETTDFPCQQHASEALNVSISQKTMLQGAGKGASTLEALGHGINGTGIVLGIATGSSSVYVSDCAVKMSFLANASVYNGALLGVIDRKTDLSITAAYVQVVSRQAEMHLIPEISASARLEIAVEGEFRKCSNGALIGIMSDGVLSGAVALNVQMTECSNCAALVHTIVYGQLDLLIVGQTPGTSQLFSVMLTAELNGYSCIDEKCCDNSFDCFLGPECAGFS